MHHSPSFSRLCLGITPSSCPVLLREMTVLPHRWQVTSNLTLSVFIVITFHVAVKFVTPLFTPSIKFFLVCFWSHINSAFASKNEASQESHSQYSPRFAIFPPHSHGNDWRISSNILSLAIILIVPRFLESYKEMNSISAFYPNVIIILIW